jgi:hypothetical protein
MFDRAVSDKPKIGLLALICRQGRNRLPSGRFRVCRKLPEIPLKKEENFIETPLKKIRHPWQILTLSAYKC